MSRGDLPSDCDLDWLIRRHRPPLRLVGSALRWAPVVLNSFQSEAHPTKVWNDGWAPFVLHSAECERDRCRDVSVVFQGQGLEPTSTSVPNSSERGRGFEWKPFGLATLNALILKKSIRGSKRVLADDDEDESKEVGGYRQ